MKSIFVLALIALFAQGLLAGPIGGGALSGSASSKKTEKSAPVENTPPKKDIPEKEGKSMEGLKEPKDEEDTPGSFQGDMMLTHEQLQEITEAIDDEKTGRTKRKATSDTTVRWPLNIVPYVITQSSQADSSTIRAAMDHWEQHTCLRFEPWTSSHSAQLGHNSYVSFFQDEGCWSYVGRVANGAQSISIGDGCAYLGIVAHEIGHAIGFHHEQSRPDRDDYIRVHTDNIREGFDGNFEKYSTNQIETHDVGYDVGSLMHYGSYAFTNNGQATITTLDPMDMQRLGNRAGLSMADIELANLYYECVVEGCPSDLQCENGGEVDPNCVCVCPSGFSGDRCETVDETDECVFLLTDQEGEITSPNYPSNYDNNNACSYRIEGAPETTIELTFLDLRIESHPACAYDAVEVRTDDVDASGQKFCGRDLPPVQTSTGNQMLVAFTSDYSVVRRGFRASYVIVGDGEGEVVGTCGGDFDGSNGAMASPNYPDNYDNNLNCVYNIEVEAGRRVELSLLDFSLEDQSSCSWDALEVDLGDGIKVPMKLCGSESPAGSLVSLGNQMVLTLRTDGSVNAGGFKASYNAIDL